jgi:hypothetical protein
MLLPVFSQLCWVSLSGAESLEESFVMVALWSHIVLVSAYHGRLLLLHLF